MTRPRARNRARRLSRALPAMAVALALAGGLTLPACGGGGSGQYTLVAYFSRAVSLYTSSDVRVLGLHVGHVAGVRVDGTQVRVTLHVNRDVPVPSDVGATIVPLSLIGERYVQLSPVWRPGQPRAADGTVIPIERTQVPVEPDEALATLKRFLDTLDPNATGRLVRNLGDDLKGNGAVLNDTIRNLAQLSTTIADKDHQLAQLIDQFERFTATLETREAQLGQVMDAFARTTSLLADERRAIEGVVHGLAVLSTNALDLVSTHRVRLDHDLTVLTRTLQSVRANIDSVQKLLDAGPILVRGAIAAYNPTYHREDLRNSFSPTLAQALGVVGLPTVCLPIDVTCTPSGASAPPAAGAPARAAGATTKGTAARAEPIPAAGSDPLDDIVALMASGPATPSLVPADPPRGQPSLADRVAGALSGIGSFFQGAVDSLLGAMR